MFFKPSVMLLMAVVAITAVNSQKDECKAYFETYCDGKKATVDLSTPCSPRYGGINTHGDPLKKYITRHLNSSFAYTQMWARFRHYKSSRDGFAKLSKKLSDDTWEDTIKLVEYLGKRGLKLKLNELRSVDVEYTFTAPKYEITGLQEMLSLHKELAVSGNSLHSQTIKREGENAVDKGDGKMQHDSELAHFLEEEFAGKHSQIVRDLSGHIHDLKKLLMEPHDKPPTGLYIHLFDEHLNKLY